MSADKVICLLGDNWPLEKAFVDSAQILLLCCHGHMFNLAVQDSIEEVKKEVKSTYRIKVKLRNLVPAARLQKATNIGPFLMNRTRGSLRYMMLQRCIELKPFIAPLDIKKTTSTMLSSRQTSGAIEASEKLWKLYLVTKFLQRRSTTILQAQMLIYFIFAYFSTTRERILTNVGTLRLLGFESALVKIQESKESSMTPAKISAVPALESEANKTGEDDHDLSYAHMDLK